MDTVEERIACLEIQVKNLEKLAEHANGIERERISYIKEAITLAKSDVAFLKAEIESLKQTRSYQSGEKESSNKWLYVLMVGIPIAISLIFKFLE